MLVEIDHVGRSSHQNFIVKKVHLTEVAYIDLLLNEYRGIIHIYCEGLSLSIEAVDFPVCLVKKALARKVQVETVHLGADSLSYNFLVLIRVHEMPVGLGEVMKQIDEDLLIVAKDAVDERVWKAKDRSGQLLQAQKLIDVNSLEFPLLVK